MTHQVMVQSFVDNNTVLNKVVLALVASWVLAASAWASIPMQPIPFSLQTLAVLLIGVALGSRLGAFSVCLYLLQGLLGLPVFVGGVGGIAAFFSPTFGYKIGFILAAFIAGYAAEYGKDRKFWQALPYLAVAHQVTFVGGVLWLSAFCGFKQAVMVGYMPFFGFDIIKFTLAAAIAASLWKLPRLRKNR